MKCPKCKKEMEEYGEGNVFYTKDILVCKNEKCEYYGIDRRDMRELTKSTKKVKGK